MIGVVMPAYQAARFIGPAIDSVIAQTYTDWELIVVDDASEDSTLGIVRRFMECDSRIRLISHTVRTGAAQGRNDGLADVSPKCRSVIFLDSDDILEPEALQVLFAALENSPASIAAHGLARMIDELGQPYLDWDGNELVGTSRYAVDSGKLRGLRKDEPTGFASFAIGSELTTPGLVLVRKSALDLEGPNPWDTAAFPADDWDLWLRLSRHGSMAFVPRVILCYRKHPAQATQAHRKKELAERLVRTKFLQSNASIEEKKIVSQGYRFAEQRISRLRIHWAAQNLRRLRMANAARQLKHGLIAYSLSLGVPRFENVPSPRHAPTTHELPLSDIAKLKGGP